MRSQVANNAEVNTCTRMVVTIALTKNTRADTIHARVRIRQKYNAQRMFMRDFDAERIGARQRGQLASPDRPGQTF